MAASRRRPRSILATLLGYLIVALLIIWLFNAVIGTIFWLLRTLVIVALFAGLVSLYIWLKRPRTP